MQAALERGPESGRQERVLVVDDEEQVLVALEDVLSTDYQVLTANSPALALRLMEVEKDVALVISDQRMPGMTGDELLTRIADKSDATRMMVTGYADLNAVVRAVNNGSIFAYVTKPWDPTDLQQMVKKGVDRFDLQRKLARRNQLLEDLMNNIPDAIYFKDNQLRFERANRTLAEVLGLADPSLAIGKTLAELGVPADIAQAVEFDEEKVLVEGAAALRILREFDGPEGPIFFSTTLAPVRAASGSRPGLVGISRDVTAREQTQRALRRLTHVRTMLGAVNAAIVRVKDREALVRESCRIAVENGGFLAACVVLLDGELYTDVVSDGQEDLGAVLTEAWTGEGAEPRWASFAAAEEPVVTNRLTSKDERDWAASIAQGGGRSMGHFPLISDGRLIGILMLVSAQEQFFDSEEVRLISELTDNIAFALGHIEKRTLLDFLAYYDELTKLPKRELLLDRLHQLMIARGSSAKPLALVLADVGRLRHVNETLGRLGGDELLIQVSRRLGSIIAEGDTLARFDGNTFAFLLPSPGTNAELATWVEETLFAALSAAMTIRGTELRASVRVGAALFPADAKTAEDLARNAEAALATARRTGQRFLFYSPGINARIGEKLTLETRLRQAIEERQFVLHYQPKVDLKTGHVVGLEALIRWHHPEEGLVSPARFIPVLEETGLILEVGSWVLEAATAQYVAWLDEGLSPPPIAANVSSIQLSQPTFVRTVEQVLDRHPRAQGGLDLELTESVLMEDLAGNIDKLKALKERGVRIAIDDFGTGYSSLGYLSRLPIDALKIDRSFVVRMSDDPQDMTIITTIISLAHSLELHVVAEGVETNEQARLLRLMRCNQVQGYFFSKPQPADDVKSQFSSKKASWPPPPR